MIADGHPMRRDPDPPPELVPGSEVPYCPWCRHSEQLNPQTWQCTTPPLRRPSGGALLCEEINKGACMFYAPSLLTRLVRLAGMRKPIIR